MVKFFISEPLSQAMRIESSLDFGFTTVMHLLSWLFVLSMSAKIISTGVLLINARRSIVAQSTAAWLWWVTKGSALSLCASALGICKLAGDTLGETVFGGLFVVAVILVFWLGMRRLRLLTLKT